MTKPLQPGEKFAISTKRSDALAIAWLNSQKNRSEAVMALIREAARRAFEVTPAEIAQTPQVPKRRSAPSPLEEPDFAGMGDFMAGLDQLGKPKV